MMRLGNGGERIERLTGRREEREKEVRWSGLMKSPAAASSSNCRAARGGGLSAKKAPEEIHCDFTRNISGNFYHVASRAANGNTAHISGRLGCSSRRKFNLQLAEYV